MSDPRANVSFNGIDAHFTTFKAHSGITAANLDTVAEQDLGVAVTMTSSDTVGKGSAGDRLVGKAVILESDGYVSVQDRGYMTLKYTSTAPTVGASVECNGDGTVRVATSNNVARGNVVVSVNTTAGTCVVRLN